MALQFLNDGYFTGKVGIGTDSPDAKLSISDTLGISGTGNDTYGQVDLVNTQTGASGDEIGPFITFRGKRGGVDSVIAAYGAIGGVNTGTTGNSTGAITFLTKSTTGAAQDLVEQMRISTGGNVGIGTDSPGSKLSINTTTAGSVPALGVNSADFNIAYNNAFGLIGGVLSNGRSYLQSQRIDGTATAYNMLLQPNGGNVGIGTDSPGYKLDVESGNIRVSSSGSGVDAYTFYEESGGPTGATVGYDSTLNSLFLGTTSDNNTNIAKHLIVRRSDGNVGIGTTSPAGRLHVSDTATLTAVYQKFTNGTTGHTSNDGTTLGIDSDGDFLINNNEAKEIKLYTSDTQRLTISSAGAVKFNAYGAGTLVTDASGNITAVGGGGAGPFLPLAGGTLTGGLIGTSATFAGNVTVGTGIIKTSIGGDIAITQGAIGLRLNDAASAISPTTATSNNDNTVDLGVSNIRFRNLYMGGTGTFGGNVGIGTTSPGVKLSLRRESNGNIFSINRPASNTFALYAGVSGNDTSFYSNNGVYKLGINNPVGTGGEIPFITMSPTNRYTTFTAGNVGIGTTSPDYELDVRANNGSIGQVFIKGGNDTVTAVGEINSELLFGSNDGSVAQGNVGGKISSVTETTNGAFTGMAFYTYRQTSPLLTEKMRITNDGNVGIGTTSPRGKLDIVGNTDNDTDFLTIQDNDTSAGSHRPSIRFRSNTAQIGQIAGLNGRMRFSSGATENSMIEILDNGNVGIGTTSPVAKLHILSPTTSSFDQVVKLSNTVGVGGGPAVFFKTSGADNDNRYGVKLGAVRSDSDNGSSVFKIQQELDNGSGTLIGLTDTFTINQYGNVGIGTTSPSAKLDIVGDGTNYALEINNSSTGDGIKINTEENQVNNGMLWFQGSKQMFNLYSDSSNNARMILRANGTSKIWLNSSGISYINGGNVGIGTTSPSAKLQVDGGIQLANDSDTASALKVGTFRYRTSGNNSYVDMCMQTGATTYAWVNIVQNNW